MIVHIFTANRYHLVPRISKGFITCYPQFSHTIVLYGNSSLDRKLYADLFNEAGFGNYVFCTNYKEFLATLGKYRNQAILFHGDKYTWLLTSILYRCKNINWVCWGAGASTKESLKSRATSPIKKFVYRSLNSIVTLIPQDRDTIIRDFGVTKEKVYILPYAIRHPDEFKDLYSELLANPPKNSKPLVLLGNNPSNIDEYIELLERLKAYAGKIAVQCMLHYSLNKNDKYYELITLGKSIYGSDFRSNEEFYESLEDFFRYINKFDIYMCGARDQSGLGAMGAALRLGKKIYLTGKNYERARSLGAHIYNIEDLNNLSYDEFATELPDEIKFLNSTRLYESTKKTPIKWVNYLKKIDTE